jgi:Glycine zipper
MQLKHIMLLAVGVAFVASEAMSGVDIFIYPGKGQTKEQQEQDEFACYKWAKEQTGFDPTQPVQQAAAPPPPGREVGRGAARGAAIGAIGGAIGGDAGKGAAIGAGVGAAGGVARRRHAEREQQAAQQQAAQQHEASINGYKRAFSACMTARGYTVS